MAAPNTVCCLLVLSRSQTHHYNTENTKLRRERPMKKAFFFVPAIVLFSLIQVYSVHAINVNINVEVLNVQNITKDTDWITIDFSQAKLWESNITSLYVAMFSAVHSNCVGDTIQFHIRPFGDVSNYRIQLSRSTSLSLTNGDEHIQYVWLPINSSNKIEYKIESISCPDGKVNVRLYVLGYDMK